MNTQRSNESSTRENKRAQFSEPARKKSKAGLAIALVVIGAGVAIAYFALGKSSDRPTVIDATPQASSAAPSNELRVPINEVSSGRAKFFDYKLPNNQQIKFFVVKSSEGDYRAALDACEVCAHAKKGYHQEGDDMVCNNCNKRFPTALIGKISGGCHPIGLTATNDGSTIAIKKSDLEVGSKYF
jgi:uncharacterized membrane protein